LGCDKKCPGLLKEFMASFTKCYKIEILKPSRLANEQFFTRPEILGCQRLFIWDAQPDFQLTSVFKWLHSSKTPDQRWLLIDARFSPIEMVVEFIEKLKQVRTLQKLN
jgi:hypothetical protein